MGTRVGTAREKTLVETSAAVVDTALLVDPICCQHSPQGLCSKGGFAEAWVAGTHAECMGCKWTEVGGRFHVSPSATHDHVVFVCKLVGDSFPWGLAWLLALALALLCSQGAKPPSVLQRGSVK